MIPRIVHYCWFGKGQKPQLVEQCIASWHRYMPGWTYMEWSEDNFAIASAPLYVRQAYEARKYAFVSDYVRLWALEQYGGVYVDVDFEVFARQSNIPFDPKSDKIFDDLLCKRAPITINNYLSRRSPKRCNVAQRQKTVDKQKDMLKPNGDDKASLHQSAQTQQKQQQTDSRTIVSIGFSSKNRLLFLSQKWEN